jgi:hypothetical protein
MNTPRQQKNNFTVIRFLIIKDELEMLILTCVYLIQLVKSKPCLSLTDTH